VNKKQQITQFKDQLRRTLKTPYIWIREWSEGSDGLSRKVINKDISTVVYKMLGRISAGQKGWTGALWAVDAAIQFDPDNVSSYLHRARYEKELKRYSDSIATLENALRINPDRHDIELLIATTLFEQQKWGDTVVALESIQTYESDPTYWYMLARSYAEIGEPEKSVKSYERGLELLQKGKNKLLRSQYLYQLGRVHNLLGDNAKSQNFYQQAVITHPDLKVKKYGLFWLHYSEEYVRDALEASKRDYPTIPDDHELLFALTNAYRRSQEWDDALSCGIRAVSLNPTSGSYHFEVGYIQEQLGEYDEAIESYDNAMATKGLRADALYRQGIVRLKQGDEKRAQVHFRDLDLLKKKLGKRYTITYGRATRYTEYYDLLSVKNNVILYESNLGRAITCNPYAIFKHLLATKKFDDYTHVWVIDRRDKVPAEYRNQKNIVFVEKHSDRYLRYLASAKYLINNSTFPAYFIRKDAQLYLNTWHGTPWKTLGEDIKGKIFEHANTARNFLQATHIISPNAHTTDVLLRSNDIDGVYTADVYEIGYPRMDSTVSLPDDQKRKLREKLGVHDDKQIVLYAPTWRGTLGREKVDARRLRSDLSKLAKQNPDKHIVFRGHHYVERLLNKTNTYSIKVVPDDVDTNELLNVVDVLISDYSSIFFDFMVTGKPILLYVYDYAEYSEQRGLYFTPGELQLDTFETIEELSAALAGISISAANECTYKDAQKKFCSYDDGKVTERTVAWLFEDKKPTKGNQVKKSNKPAAIMFGGGYRANGISLSFLNLLNRVDTSMCNYATIVVPHELREDPEKYERFLRQPKEIIKLGQVGRINLTPLEADLLADFEQTYSFGSDEAKGKYEKIYAREARRVFGATHFQAAINYEGYRPYWSSLFGRISADNKSIYMHNDLYSEWSHRFPRLGATFLQFPNYDKLIGVSQATRDTNSEKLSGPFAIPKAKFDYCDNIQNSQQTIERAKEKIPANVEKIIQSARGNAFVAVGRLSPEKDHQKLVRAFNRVVQKVPHAQLIICGDGPLRTTLDKLVKQLKLQSNVHLLGFTKNPYPIVAASDCFVLSSNYEGQPVVFYEAFALGRPVIATDIPANRDVLKDGYGLLVDNSEDGLYEGMRDFTEGRVEVKPFDSKLHENRSLKMFYEKVVGL